MAEFDEIIDMPPRKRKRRWAKRLGWAITVLLVPIVLAAAFLSSPIGKRFVADQIAQMAPASGLRIAIGRIEGDIYSKAVLYDVVLSDPKGEFLTVPEVELEWHPLAWLWSGLDVRELVAKRGRVERLPELLPGDPDAPILPDFDIRIDRFAVEDWIIAAGVAGPDAHTLNFSADALIKQGRTRLNALGKFGAKDRFDLKLDAEPDGDRFDMALDYSASANGPMAQITGLGAGYEAKVIGDGTWSNWLGHGHVTRIPPDGSGDAPSRAAAFRLTNKSGEYGILGQISPQLGTETIMGRAAAERLSIALSGRLEDSTFTGALAAVSSAIDARGRGAVDLARNRFDGFDTRLAVRDGGVLGNGTELTDARMTAQLDGPFRALKVANQINVGELALGTITLQNLRNESVGDFDGEFLRLPLDVTLASVSSGVEWLDPQLVDGRLNGLLVAGGGRLDSDNARLTFPALAGQLTLRGDTTLGVYAIGGPVDARAMPVDSVGTVTANAKLLATFGITNPWSVRANFAGLLDDVSNGTIANVAGQRIELSGAFGMASGQPMVLRDVIVESERLTAAIDSRIVGERTSLSGGGQHVDFGPFTVDAAFETDGPRATLVLADPFPAAGLRDVRVAIAPEGQGFAIDAAGGSLLGPFDGAFSLSWPADGPAQVAIKRLRVYRTNVTGDVVLADGGARGDLALEGGGLNGTISLVPSGEDIMRFAADINARQARFAGEVPLGLASADITARGTLRPGNNQIEADISGSGLEYGQLSIARFAGRANVTNGSGSITASIAGRRSERFALKFDADVAPDRIALLSRGEYGGEPITMPRRAVFTTLEQGGWSLAPAQIGYAGGFAIVEGAFGNDEARFTAQLSDMPLRLADLAGSELGLGGRLSGVVNWSQVGSGLPTGDAKVRIDNFSRSGLVLSSTPVDLLAVAELTPDALSLAARLRDGSEPLGRLDARIEPLAESGSLSRRIMDGQLAGSLAYDGNASSLWRLAAIEAFDLTGPITLNARATGSINAPRISGALASDNLRLQSAISGTTITDISTRGRFVGSRLELTRFAGKTSGGGGVSGSGSVDFAEMSVFRGPRIDIRAAASNARLINANGLDATITGPLRIVSDGLGGTIAGRVRVNRASWALGVAAEDLSLPQIATSEVNRTDNTASTRTPASGSWRYLVNANAPSGVAVDGMGLNSEWGVDIALRGTVSDPRIGGEARLVRGNYTFAGSRFDLTRGRITFDASAPIDPRLDIAAETAANGTDVAVAITGNAQTPQVAFSSTPALPEEEILAQLLFGGSVTSLSATDALQLGAAVAALRGGSGGIDPIGDLRRSIGLDQLRIVSADPAIGRGTGVALGKNIGGRFYVEIVTDGRGYSATSVEYRVTRWLALLATVSTIGRDSVLAEVSRDY